MLQAVDLQGLVVPHSEARQVHSRCQGLEVPGNLAEHGPNLVRLVGRVVFHVRPEKRKGRFSLRSKLGREGRVRVEAVVRGREVLGVLYQSLDRVEAVLSRGWRNRLGVVGEEGVILNERPRGCLPSVMKVASSSRIKSSGRIVVSE